MSGTPTPIVVTKCLDCPWSTLTDWFTVCQHPDAPEDHSFDTDAPTPDWCPLRTSPALVVLRPEGLQSPPLDGAG